MKNETEENIPAKTQPKIASLMEKLSNSVKKPKTPSNENKVRFVYLLIVCQQPINTTTWANTLFL